MIVLKQISYKIWSYSIFSVF